MKSETIVIPKELRAELDSFIRTQVAWTPEMDAVLREYGSKISKPNLAKIMAKQWSGVTLSRIRKRMDVLGIAGHGPNAKET